MLKARVENAITLGTLLNATTIGDNIPDAVDERAFLLSTQMTITLRGLTPGEGPILVGLAHSDYTDPEIEQWIENVGGWSEGDLVQQEVSKRKIRQIGMFDGVAAEEVLNEGLSIKTTCKWILTQGQTLKVWAHNRSGATLTTGAVVLFDGHAWVVPQ